MQATMLTSGRLAIGHNHKVESDFYQKLLPLLMKKTMISVNKWMNVNNKYNDFH